MGKTTTAVRCGLTAIERGEKAAYFLFDEGIPTMLARTRAMGMDLQAHIDSGAMQVFQIDPAELSPGEFASWIAPPKVGIDNQPGDFEYVKLHMA